MLAVLVAGVSILFVLGPILGLMCRKHTKYHHQPLVVLHVFYLKKGPTLGLLLHLRLLERALGLEILAFRYLTQLRQLLVAEALSDLPPATLTIGVDPSPKHGALGRTLLMPSIA